jgi:predicted LPLAT superfamily acyltransferase
VTSLAARHWAAIGESTFVTGIWALYALHRLLGRTVVRWALVPVAFVYWLIDAGAREASRQYLHRVSRAGGQLGRGGDVIHGVRHFHSFAETILDKLLAASGRYRGDLVSFDGKEILDAMLSRNQGAILVIAHIGCLELCQAVAGSDPRLRLTVLVHTRHAERFNRILARLDPGSPVRLLQVTELDAAMAALLAQRVGQGEFVAIAGDRVPVQSARTVLVPFLGRDAALPIGAYVMASAVRCPLVWLGCTRQGAGHHVRFEMLAESVEIPRARREAALRDYSTRFARCMEAALVARPYEWFNFFPFWDQPGKAPAIPLPASEVESEQERRNHET